MPHTDHVRHAPTPEILVSSRGSDPASQVFVEFEATETPTDIACTTLPTARVIVVDDDEDMRVLVAMTLRREGMEVIEAILQFKTATGRCVGGSLQCLCIAGA